MLERGAPVWSGVYGAGSSLQHAAQLQLLSQQQMFRQQELLMIQQHTAQVLEMQRNAQLVVGVEASVAERVVVMTLLNHLRNPVHVDSRVCRVFQEHLKANEDRTDMEDKADKRHGDPKPRPSSICSPSPSPILHSRKPPPPLSSPSPSTSSLTPLPPLASPLTALKSEEGRQRGLAHPPAPLPHPPSPRSVSPPPLSPRRPKQELADDGGMGRREQREERKLTPFQGIYPGESSSQLLFNFTLFRLLNNKQITIL